MRWSVELNPLGLALFAETVWWHALASWRLDFQSRLEINEPLVQRLERAVALPGMTLGAVANALLERRQQVEGDVRRLEALAVGRRDVVHQRAAGSGARRRRRRVSLRQKRGVHA